MAYLAGGNGPEPGNGGERERPHRDRPRATSRSRSTASSATCARWRWSAPTARSTGTARRGSTPRRCSAPCSTPARAATSRCRSRTSYARPKQLYLPDTNILLTRFQGKEAVGEVIDFMVPETTQHRPGARPAGQAGPRGARPGHLRARLPSRVRLRPRRSRASQIIQGVGAVFTSALGRAVLRTNVPLKAEEQRRRRDVHPGGGRERRLPPGVERRGPPDHRGRDRRAVHQDPGLLAELGEPVPLPRPVAGDGAAVRARAQAARLPPDRRPGRRARPRALPEEPGGGAELGLPLRLAPGRRVHRLRPDAPGLPRGGRELHGLAAEALRDRHRQNATS